VYTLSARSLRNLKGVHPDLVRVVHRAIKLTPIDFIVTEGLRTLARQKELVAAGASRTMNSRHLGGFAIDFAPLVAGKVRWDWPLFNQMGPVFEQAGKELGVALVWGGRWRTFKDGPHVELAREVYS
jgi:peptidoglycan L-alanyl-D-glutamate endopeptidase CwlK